MLCKIRIKKDCKNVLSVYKNAEQLNLHFQFICLLFIDKIIFGDFTLQTQFQSQKDKSMKIKDLTQQRDSIQVTFLVYSISVKTFNVSSKEKQLLHCTINDGTALMFALFQLSRKNQISLNKTFKIQNAKTQDIDGTLYLTLGTNSKIKLTEDLKLMNKAQLVNVSEEYKKRKQEKRRRFMTKPKKQSEKINQAEEQFVRYASSRSNSRSIKQSLQKVGQNIFDRVDQESQGQNQYQKKRRNHQSRQKQKQKLRGQAKYKRVDLDLFNDFINELYYKMEEQSLNFTRCRQILPITDQFCNMPLSMSKKQVGQIIKYQTKWGKDNNRPQDQIDYVIRVRIFEENFDKCREQMKEKLGKQKEYIERSHLIDRTGSYPQNFENRRDFKPKGKPQPRTQQRKQAPPSRNRQRTEVNQRGRNNKMQQKDSRQYR